MKSKLQPWLPLLLVFILINSVFLISKDWLAGQGVNHEVVLGGNLVLMAATSLSFWVSLRSLRSANPHASVRAMYSSFMIKFFVCAIAAFVYIMAAKKNLNKPGLIICMGLYIVYTSLEVSSVMKLLKQKKNA